jgi:hypothetical protein
MTSPNLSRVVILAAALGGLALPVAAQTRYPYSLTLYDQPDYRGGSVTFYGDNANIGSTGFASRARSAQIRGAWRLCEGGGYRNRCEVLNLNIRDLDAYGFSGRVGSAQLLGPAAPQPAPQAGPAPPAYVPAPYLPPAPPAAPYRPAPYAVPAPYTAPAPVPSAPPSRFAPYNTPAPAAIAPTYVAPYAAGSYEPIPDTLPPAVDAPLTAPSRFGRSYDPPPIAATPRGYGPPAYPAPDAQAAPMPPQPAPYQPGPVAQSYASDPAQGATTVFFPFPTVRGADVSAASPRAADSFCRVQGLGPAIHFDQSQRFPRAVDIDGRAVGEGPVLRDVLCRR